MKKCWLPARSAVYYLVKNSHVTKNIWPNLEVYTDTDKYEDLSTVVCVKKGYYMPPFEKTYTMHSSDVRTLQSLLTDLVDWKQNKIIFSALPVFLLTGLIQLCKTKGFEVQPDQNIPFRQYWSTLAKIPEVTLPSGLREGALDLKYVDFLNKHWQSTWGFPLPDFKKALKHQPSFAVYDEHDQAISWSVLKEFGDLGYGYTSPEHRNKRFLAYTNTRAVLEFSKLHPGETIFCFMAKRTSSPRQDRFLSMNGYDIKGSIFHWSVFRRI